jgi:hypothetical protein
MPSSSTSFDHADAATNMRFPMAAQLFRDIPEISEDMSRRPADETAPAFLRALLIGDIPEEAITFAAYALKPRHSVWWAHECLTAIAGVLAEADRQMLAVAAAWVAQPDDTTRESALTAGCNATVRSPGVWVAIAAGWSGGSMAPPDQPDVPAPAFLTGRAVNAAVLTALACIPIDQRRQRLGHFVSMAEVLARGS